MSREAMKLALSTLEGWANYDDWVWPESALEQSKRNTIEAITALRQALEEEREPLYWSVSTGWVYADDTSQERVDETSKDRLVRIMGTFDLATGHADTMEQVLDALEDELRDVLGHLRARREWQGLTDDEIMEPWPFENRISFARWVETKVREKNT